MKSKSAILTPFPSQLAVFLLASAIGIPALAQDAQTSGTPQSAPPSTAQQTTAALNGRLGDAIAAAEAVLRRTQAQGANDPETAFNLGNALHGLGRLREAADQYRQALVLRPGYADALNNLANVHKALGEFAGCMLIRFDPSSGIGRSKR